MKCGIRCVSLLQTLLIANPLTLCKQVWTGGKETLDDLPMHQNLVPVENIVVHLLKKHTCKIVMMQVPRFYDVVLLQKLLEENDMEMDVYDAEITPPMKNLSYEYLLHFQEGNSNPVFRDSDEETSFSTREIMTFGGKWAERHARGEFTDVQWERICDEHKGIVIRKMKERRESKRDRKWQQEDDNRHAARFEQPDQESNQKHDKLQDAIFRPNNQNRRNQPDADGWEEVVHRGGSKKQERHNDDDPWGDDILDQYLR